MHPYRSIWLHPARTIAAIAHDNPGFRVMALPVLAGLAILPSQALFAPGTATEGYGIVLLSLLSFGPVVEVVQVYAGAHVLRWIGLPMGGRAGVDSLRTVIAWSNVPIVAVAALGLLVFPVSFAVSEVTGSGIGAARPGLVTVVGLALVVVQFALVAWSLVILCSGLARIQSFSLGRAVTSAVVAWLLVVLAVAMLAQTFDPARPLGEVLWPSDLAWGPHDE